MPITTEKLIKRQRNLLRRMRLFGREITAADCAGLAGQGQKIEYTHQHKNMKRKGGRPPVDYTAVEMLVDFKAALEKNNFDEAIPLYYALRRLLNWD